MAERLLAKVAQAHPSASAEGSAAGDAMTVAPQECYGGIFPPSIWKCSSQLLS